VAAHDLHRVHLGPLFPRREDLPPGGEKPLLVLRDMGLRELVEEVRPTRVVALTSHGQPGSFQELGETLAGDSFRIDIDEDPLSAP